MRPLAVAGETERAVAARERGEPRAPPAFSLPPRGWLAVAACTLGVGLFFGDGQLDAGGITFLVLTWGAVVAAFTSRAAENAWRVERVLEVGVVIQFVFLLGKPPGRHLLPDLVQHEALAAVFPMTAVLMAMLAVSILVKRPLLGRFTFPGVVALAGIAAGWMLFASPHPPIDVLDFARESARALAAGRNPYDLHFPNMYGNTAFFGPGFATPERIDVGLVYPPLSLLLTAPAELLFHDSRVALVLALVLGAVLIDRLGDRAARLAALLFVSSPRQYFVIEHGWTEPLVVACFALVLLLATRRSVRLPLALGALLALKQFAVLFLPLTPLLVGEGRRRRAIALLGRALLVMGAIVLPFLLWDPHAYLRSTVLFHLAQPFRRDSLSFAALWAWARGGVSPPTTLPTLALVAVATVVALRRCRATPGGFAAGSALVLFALLAWSKQAHCNYHYLVVGLLLCSVAVTDPSVNVSSEHRTVG